MLMRAIIILRLKREAVFTMTIEKFPKNRLIKAVFGLFLAFFGMISGMAVDMNTTPVFAEPVEQEVVEEVVEENVVTEENVEPATDEATAQTETVTAAEGGASCKDSMGSIGWWVCPVTGTLAKAIDFMYGAIRDILVINPVEIKDGQPVYEIWKYFRSITNIVFIIFLLVVVYSQITGFGISNYGVKKALPKLIVMAIMVNLSFIICSLLVDVSNIVGDSLRGVFENVETASIATMNWDSSAMGIKMSNMYEALAGGLVIGGVALAFNPGSIFMLVPVILGAIVAVASGLITIALRQAVVVLLIVIAPLAMVANVLPNTESLFTKWKNLLTRMLVFYPMFSLLFGAAHLAGFVIIASAKDGLGLIIGIAVQIFPLFFCWKLMEMSGTMLGTINSKLRGLAAKPIAASQGWAESHRALTNAKSLQYGTSPASHLKRYLDNQKARRENKIKSLTIMRQNDASTYVQRRIASGYDGSKAKGTDGDFKPNEDTRIAKDLSNSELIAKRTAMDTKHAISNYGSYYVDKSLRDGKKYDSARQGVSAEALNIARANDEDYQRNKLGGNEFLELYRAQMTEEHDTEADTEFATGTFLKVVKPNSEEEMDRYNHYVLSAAGGLGDNRADRVLGKIISRAAGVEASQRRDIAYIGAKWAVPKYPLRNMAVGYHHNSDGYAINQNGEQIENERGYLLNHDPSQLWWWENVDPIYGPYFDWTDENGNFVTRVYKSNGPAMKELLANFDIPINDPVNNLYAILSGIMPGENNGLPHTDGENINMKFVGLGKLKTTLSSSLGVFKEKNSAFGPMVAEMIKQGSIKNYTDLNIAYLDSLNKTTKPGNFNIQDGDAIKMMTRMIDKSQWDALFLLDELKKNVNIDHEPLLGLDENGQDVDFETATREDFMRRIEKKYAAPAAIKMVAMMARITPNTLDNQKISTLEKWKKLVETAEQYWGDEIEESGYTKELRKVKRRFNERINGNRGRNAGGQDTGENDDGAALNEFNDDNPRLTPARRNILMVLDEIYNDSLDGYAFLNGVENYLLQENLGGAWSELNGQVDAGTMTIDEMYRIAVSVLSQYMD